MEAALEMIELLTPFSAQKMRRTARAAKRVARRRGGADGRGTGINPASARRAVARKLAMQALYRWQINAAPWQDVVNEFAAEEDMRKADRGYFNQLVTDICGGSEALDVALAAWMDRKPTELDPVERAVLWVGAHELQVGARRAVSRGDQRSRRTRQALRRHRQSQVRQRGAGPGGAGAAPARTLVGSPEGVLAQSEFELIGRYFGASAPTAATCASAWVTTARC